jgi:hypothetical protein
MRTTLVSLGLVSLALGLVVACDREPSKLDALLEASNMAAGPADAAAPVARVDQGHDGGTATGPSDASTFDGAMPPRPIPKPSMTVGSGMGADVQMKAITYMAAMAQPRFDDAPADGPYANALAEQLRPIVLSFDKGTPEDKLRLDRIEVVASGRRIDLYMAEGCDAQLPAHVAQRTSTSLLTLLSHGVLVLRCNDARAQCLQSTRDATDVLCTTAPRHR